MSDKGNTATIRRRLFEFFEKHPASVPTAIYIYLTLFGMFDAYLHFSSFGINVFKYSELNDFIMAAFRNPSSILLIVYALIYYIFLVYLLKKSNFYKNLGKGIKESIKYYIDNFLLATVFFIVPILVVLFVPIYDPFSSKSEPVTVAYRVANGQAGEGWSRDEVEHIGTTAKFMFFVDDNMCFMVVPTSNVQVIRERPPPQTEEGTQSENGGTRTSKLEKCRKMVGTDTSTRSNQ